MWIVATTEMVQTGPELIHWIGYLLIVGIAGGLSAGLRRLTRMEAGRSLQRWVPAAHVGIWLVALVLVVVGVASYGFSTSLLLVLLAFAVMVIAGLGWLRSVLAGVVLFAESEISPGDRIQVGEHKGVVVSVGIRSLRIRAVDGVIHDIPHQALLETPLSRFPSSGDLICAIDLELNSGEKPEELLERLRTIAGLAPLASPRRRPEAFFREPPVPGEVLKVRLHAYPCSSEYSEELRSEVLRRVAKRFH